MYAVDYCQLGGCERQEAYNSLLSYVYKVVKTQEGTFVIKNLQFSVELCMSPLFAASTSSSTKTLQFSVELCRWQLRGPRGG